MVKIKKVLKTVIFKTCRVNEEIVDGGGHGSDITWKAAYSLVDGSYIGSAKSAEHFERKGILPQAISSEHKVASIGFCKKEQKWYGFSHRAMYGFGVGSKVKKSSCGYKPTDTQDFLDDMIRFWVDDEDEWTTKSIILRQELDITDPNKDREGLGAYVKYSRIRKSDNKTLISDNWSPYPDQWGRGEWEAKSLEDAKEMAVDFARGVS